MHKKAFSLAELMIVLLVMTIILAATMPILSKRAKVKAAAAAGSKSNTLTCTTNVKDTLSKPITADMSMLFYFMYGGGNGGSNGLTGTYLSSVSRYQDTAWGGEGGNTIIAVDTNVIDIAYGGSGSDYWTFSSGYAGNGAGESGKSASGFIPLNLSAGKTLNVYVGGGGGGAGRIHGGGPGASKTFSSYPPLSSSLYGGSGRGVYVSAFGTYIFPRATLLKSIMHLTSDTDEIKCADGGTSTAGGTVATGCTGGGGGAYGGKGGDGVDGTTTSTSSSNGWGLGIANATGNPGLTTSANNTGLGGTNGTATTPYGTGGYGGSATLVYFTTASSCPW